MNVNINDIVSKYAISCHDNTNHRYGNYPYSKHLQHVHTVAYNYIHLIPEESHDLIFAACWCHDLIEDTRQTYNDVKMVVGSEVAEIVFALTNEKGRYRKDRANGKYYEGIRATPYADFVKICDRIANVESCITEGNEMLNMYIKEQPYFNQQLFNRQYAIMLNYLDDILETKTIG